MTRQRLECAAANREHEDGQQPGAQEKQEGLPCRFQSQPGPADTLVPETEAALFMVLS